MTDPVVRIKRKKKKSLTRREQFMANFEEWVGYWRANPHRFITDYLGLMLYDFQKVLIYMMFMYPRFIFIASTRRSHIGIYGVNSVNLEI